ncbi:MAG: nucleoside hydrolase [Gordonia sp. (in: high G+C Gram-positive bacteria)]
MTASTPAPVYFDTDLGIDDSLALAYLLGAPEVAVKGVGTVSGNCSAAQAARNTLDLLGLADRTDIPVAVGCTDWLAHPFDGGSPEVHGDNGVGGITMPRAAAEPVDEHAVDMLIRLAHEHPGTLRIVAIAPFTNLAAAITKDPTIVAKVDTVVVMGGAALAPGNMTPVSEANVMHDPEAAAIVFAAPWPIVMVGLDVTMQHTFGEDDRAALADSPRPVAQALAAMLSSYADFYVGIYGRRTVALHDPLAAAVACGTVELTSAPTVGVVVDDTDGPGRGQTICDLRGRFRGYPDQPGAHTRVVLDCAGDFAAHLRERLLTV